MFWFGGLFFVCLVVVFVFGLGFSCGFFGCVVGVFSGGHVCVFLFTPDTVVCNPRSLILQYPAVDVLVAFWQYQFQSV